MRAMQVLGRNKTVGRRLEFLFERISEATVEQEFEPTVGQQTMIKRLLDLRSTGRSSISIGASLRRSAAAVSTRIAALAKNPILGQDQAGDDLRQRMRGVPSDPGPKS